jgi:hypothetical protein
MINNRFCKRQYVVDDPRIQRRFSWTQWSFPIRTDSTDTYLVDREISEDIIGTFEKRNNLLIK